MSCAPDPAAATAVSSACRRASISLQSPGLVVATVFLLPTTSWAGGRWLHRPSPHFLLGIRVRYCSASSSSICTTQICCCCCCCWACRRASISLQSSGLAVTLVFLLSTTSWAGRRWLIVPLPFPRWDTSTVLQRKQQQTLRVLT